jgi:integrase
MGLRRGEICALTKQDIDMERKLLTVSKSMVLTDSKEWIVKQPKTYRGNRVLPITDLVYSFLTGYNTNGDYLFTVTPNALSDRFFRLVKRCDIAPFTFHALRHYYASVMMTLNIPNKYAMQMMGHASDNMLKNVYQHTMIDKKKEVEQAVTQFFSNSDF